MGGERENLKRGTRQGGLTNLPIDSFEKKIVLSCNTASCWDGVHGIPVRVSSISSGLSIVEVLCRGNSKKSDIDDALQEQQMHQKILQHFRCLRYSSLFSLTSSPMHCSGDSTSTPNHRRKCTGKIVHHVFRMVRCSTFSGTATSVPAATPLAGGRGKDDVAPPRGAPTGAPSSRREGWLKHRSSGIFLPRKRLVYKTAAFRRQKTRTEDIEGVGKWRERQSTANRIALNERNLLAARKPLPPLVY